MTKKRLLVLLGVLLALRFFAVPLLAWQSDRVESISAKSRQLGKIDTLVEFASSSADSAEVLHQKIQLMQQIMLDDSDTAKLSVQQFLSNVFAANDMTVTTFEWIADENEDDRLRSLRARLRFDGSVENMITSFASISLASKTLKIVEWDQRFVQDARGSLGVTRGSVVVHIPLLKRRMVFADVAPEGAKNE